MVLHPALAVCAKRAAERLEGKIADYKPYEDFYALFEGVENAICDDGASTDELTKRIAKGLQSGCFAA